MGHKEVNHASTHRTNHVVDDSVIVVLENLEELTLR